MIHWAEYSKLGYFSLPQHSGNSSFPNIWETSPKTSTSNSPKGPPFDGPWYRPDYSLSPVQMMHPKAKWVAFRVLSFYLIEAYKTAGWPRISIPKNTWMCWCQTLWVVESNAGSISVGCSLNLFQIASSYPVEHPRTVGNEHICSRWMRLGEGCVTSKMSTILCFHYGHSPWNQFLLPAPKPCAAKQVNPKNYGKDVFLPYEHAAPFAGLEWLRPSAGIGIWDEGSLSGSKYWRSLMMGWATISHIYPYIYISMYIDQYTHSVDRGTHGNGSNINTRRTTDAPHPWWIYLSNHTCRFQIQRHLTCTSFGQHLTIWQYPWNSLDLPNHLGISKNISQHSQLSWGVPGLRWPAWGFDGRKRPMKYIFTVDPRTRHRAAAWPRGTAFNGDGGTWAEPRWF